MTSIRKLVGAGNSNIPTPLARGYRRYTSQTWRRSALSKIWNPTGGIATNTIEDGHGKLIRAGYLRQSHPGIFHFLPLGVRVVNKIEGILDEEMSRIGASKVSLSSITSQDLWEKSERFSQLSPELFKFADRRGVSYMLSPTHEEEITQLVSRISHSYKDLPLRLYQISRKYRDEPRPRHGLLRCREFIMKDLYTFDASLGSAFQTYDEVRSAYSRFFSRLKLPFLAAEASCGDMGGNLSHEYHAISSLGEDQVVSCAECGYAVNEEIAEAGSAVEPAPDLSPDADHTSGIRVWRGISKDRRTLINAWYPSDALSPSPAEINHHAVKRLVPDLDSSVEDPITFWEETLGRVQAQGLDATLVNLVDYRIRHLVEAFASSQRTRGAFPIFPNTLLHTDLVPRQTITTSPQGRLLNLVRIQTGDSCPSCKSGTVVVQKALELGHAFHLGTRYSEPMEAHVFLPTQTNHDQSIPAQRAKAPLIKVPLQMGCYGIGLTRVIGAIADKFADQTGLVWPLDIAPYEVVVIPDTDLTLEAGDIYDTISSLRRRSGNGMLPIDAVLDDRRESMVWKMKDADLVGYPVLVILGRAWRQGLGCEVQCRRLARKDVVPVEDLPKHLKDILGRLYDT